MKQINRIMAALLALALCLGTVAALAESGTVWTTGSVNMRTGPGLGYGVIRSLGAGKKLSYDKTSTDGRGVKWYRIEYKGRSGWISSKYASLKQPSGGSSGSSRSKVTTTACVNLRSGAGVGYAVLRTIPEGTSLSYDKSKKDARGVTWYRVTYRKSTGWISSRYARKSGSSGGDSVSGRKVKTTGSVHLRAGAGLGYKSICCIPKGTTLTYDETRTDGRGVAWYHVAYEGKTGWVSSRYARKK